MNKKYNGIEAPSILTVTREVTLALTGKVSRFQERLNGLINVTVMRKSDVSPETELTERNVTVIVAVAGPQNTRRATGFGEFADALDQLNVGDVVELYGKTIYNNNGINGSNGMAVEVIKVISKADPMAIEEGQAELIEDHNDESYDMTKGQSSAS
jgi:hypothetical protein